MSTIAKGTNKYGDLSKRLWFLLGALIVYRIGAHIPVPGIDPAVLADLFKSQKNGILGMFNMFFWRRIVALYHFCFRYYALHFCFDYHAVGGDSRATA